MTVQGIGTQQHSQSVPQQSQSRHGFVVDLMGFVIIEVTELLDEEGRTPSTSDAFSDAAISGGLITRGQKSKICTGALQSIVSDYGLAYVVVIGTYFS